MSEKRITLKILIDVKSNKVVFAVSGKDFVDYIFNLMTLPLSTVTTQLNPKPGDVVGCLGSLYRSFQCLGSEYYESKEAYLSVAKLVSVPSLGNTSCRNQWSYVKEGVLYIVTDNLKVKPMSISLIMSLVKDFDYLEEKEVTFGRQEGLALLKASLEKQAVLTTVFLGDKK